MMLDLPRRLRPYASRCSRRQRNALIRKRFYEHDRPIDEYRTILFGHSTTTKVGPCPGQVAASNMTCMMADLLGSQWMREHSITSPLVLLQSMWIHSGSSNKPHFAASAGSTPTRRESVVGDYWGLSVLKSERRKEMTKQLKHRRQLRMAGPFCKARKQ